MQVYVEIKGYGNTVQPMLGAAQSFARQFGGPDAVVNAKKSEGMRGDKLGAYGVGYGQVRHLLTASFANVDAGKSYVAALSDDNRRHPTRQSQYLIATL